MPCLVCMKGLVIVFKLSLVKWHNKHLLNPNNAERENNSGFH